MRCATVTAGYVGNPVVGVGTHTDSLLWVAGAALSNRGPSQAEAVSSQIQRVVVLHNFLERLQG